MQPITVLLAVFVLSFIAGFGWRTGSVAARAVARMLGRETPRATAKARSASEAKQIKN